MKSIQRRFKNIQEKNPYWSSMTCFNEAIKEQGFSKKNIYYWFSRLVDKKDYSKSDKKEILSFLLKLSKRAEEGIKKGKISPKRELFV
ncbi:MAG: hypothetical protein ACOXZ1_00235 [Patescibacteria group bacterium]|jgi:hypothetical protein